MHAQYMLRYKPIAMKDDDTFSLYWARVQNTYQYSTDGYATINGGLNVGRMS
jgi:hypothetical protein